MDINMRKITVGFIIWVVAAYIMIPKPVKNTVDVKEILEMPSVIDVIEDEIKKIKEEKMVMEFELEREEQKKRQKQIEVVSRGADRGLFTVTAYDLSYASCGKEPSHPAYGITANGTSLKGHTLESARAIAVDCKVIKLGSKVHIEFLDEEYKHLDGFFTAVDVGGAIKGKKIDVFFGSGDVKDAVKQFGRRKAKITVVNE